MTFDETGVLEANVAFYEAFARRDLQAMAAIWAHRSVVSCVHPGHRPLLGREVVLASWRAILTSPTAPQIDCRGARALAAGTGAFVICTELVNGVFLAATNVFVREDDAWRIVHHQAGACPPPPEVAEMEVRKTLQ